MDPPVKLAIRLFRVVLVSVLVLCVWNAVQAKADTVEYLKVSSPAMGRDIPVAFQAGGPHVVVLLDAFNAAADVSRWVAAADAMDTLAGKGFSVVAPAGGAWSMYTNWEADASKQWETFLADELPNWLSETKRLAPGGHAVVGAGQGGTAALTLAAFHPERYHYAGSMSGFLTPSATTMNGAIAAGLSRFGGVNSDAMWGPAQLGRWKWHDPDVHVQKLADNNTRLWVFSPSALSCTEPSAMIDYCDQAQASSRIFYQHYRAAGGNNGHFDFPTGAQHDWDTWKRQLAAMSADLAATLR